MKILSLITFVVASLSGAMPARAIYTFTNIADSTGMFNSFGAPGVNADGLVAFRSSLDAAGRAGIYVGNGVSVTTIADNLAGPFNIFDLGTPAIDDEGTVAFLATQVMGPPGIYTGNGGMVTTYTSAVSGVGINSLGRPSMNNDGDIAFRGTHTLVPAGSIHSAVFANLTPLASSSGEFQNFGNGAADIDLNESGEVVFTGQLDSGVKGVYASSVGQGVVTVADTSSQFFDFTFSSPSINDEGAIAFHATLIGGGQGIFLGSADGDPVTTYVDHTGPYSSFSPVASMNLGDIAFTGSLDGGGFGLFVGPDPVADRAIKIGDPLFGSTVNEIIISNTSLNDAGQIAFRYGLGDGRRGIALATPVPSTGSADFDDDNDVDGQDFLIWQRGFGILGSATRSQGDANGDLDIDRDDLLVWGQQFGEPVAVSAVPEPATLVMAAVVAPACYLARRRSSRTG